MEIPDPKTLSDLELCEWDDVIGTIDVMREMDPAKIQAAIALADDSARFDATTETFLAEKDRRELNTTRLVTAHTIEQGEGIDQAEWRPREKLLAMSAARLVKFIQLDAPAEVIREEIRLIVERTP